jgi:hypothetical protein
MVKYISFAGILTIASALLSSAAMAANEVEIALEAELASKIQAPLVIGVPADAKKHGGTEPDEPSNGKFIWAPGAPVTGGGGSGFAEYIIHIPKDGTYTIWGRAVAWDGNSDSFWVTWDPADGGENPQKTGNQDLCWCATNGNTWVWDRVNRWPAGGDRQWELDKGETKLTIWSREDATMLDCLFITDNLATTEGAAGVRLPTDEDRKIQESTRAVQAAGKLSTMWGLIRSEY